MTCPFDEYLKIPGWSHSGIKYEGQDFNEPTEKMQLGTKVHNYLGNPEDYDYSDIDIIRPLAAEVKKAIGPLWEFLQKEVAITADFIHEGFLMKYKGRIDLGIRDKIVIDLKVSELDPYKSMEFFRYDRPISGYCAGFNAPLALLLSINPKTKKTSLKRVPLSYDWWEEQVLIKGEPIL